MPRHRLQKKRRDGPTVSSPIVLKHAFPQGPPAVNDGRRLSSGQQQAAVHDDRLTVNIGCERRSEEKCDSSHIFRRSNAPCGGLLLDSLQPPWVLDRHLGQLGIDKTRRDPVDPNSVPSIRVRQRSRQRHSTGLGSAVCRTTSTVVPEKSNCIYASCSLSLCGGAPIKRRSRMLLINNFLSTCAMQTSAQGRELACRLSYRGLIY